MTSWDKLDMFIGTTNAIVGKTLLLLFVGCAVIVVVVVASVCS